jgi:hypothetical protein
MASLLPGYEYDIFISYRQKDNKGERWVSEFVEALKTELESTFKEEISVYFDINPHDGLLETHDVNASLKEKLKCLVFIPIISQTYCDPQSFAWQHELKKSSDTFVVIVTRGHKDDAEALKPCIGSHLAYTGMIGSNNKIKAMNNNFIKNGGQQVNSGRLFMPR